MIGLPHALGDWAEELALFPHDVAATLLPWLPRIAAAIGPLHHHASDGDGAPDGFGGLTRRGSYERLLLSEWAIAEEVPMEFLRRAAMSEHTFLEVARRSPSASRFSVALFDAGPHQIGAPRIAHLATLIVLARRARRANVPFSWGVLQDGARRTFGHVDEQSVLNLLLTRSALEATRDDVDAFRLGLATEETPLEDLWFIGGDHTARLIEGLSANHVHVEESMDVDARALELRVERSSAARTEAPRPAALELPEPRACVRLLRDPFEVKKPTPARIPLAAHGASLVVSANGRRLLMRTKAGVLALGFPQRTLESLAHPRHLGAQRGPICAVGWWKKNYWVLSVDEATPVLSRRSKRGQLQSQIELEAKDVQLIAPGADAPLGVLIAIGDLFYWHTDGGDVLAVDAVAKTIRRVETDVVAAGRRAGRLWVIVARDGRTHLRRIDSDGVLRTKVARFDLDEYRRSFEHRPQLRDTRPSRIEWPVGSESGFGALCRDHEVVVVEAGAYIPVGSPNRWDAEWPPTRPLAPIDVPDDRTVLGAYTPSRDRPFRVGVVAATAARDRIEVHTANAPPYEIWADESAFESALVYAHFVVVHNGHDQIVIIDADRARILRSFLPMRLGT